MTRDVLINSCTDYIEQEINKRFTTKGRDKINSMLVPIYKKYKADYVKYAQCFNHMRERTSDWDTAFIEILDDWLVPQDLLSTSLQTKAPPGRPPKKIADLGRSSLYNKSHEIAENAAYNDIVLLRAAKHSVEHNGCTHLGEILSTLIRAYEKGYVQNITVVNSSGNEQPEKLSPEEALREILYNDLSKRTYQNLKNTLDKKKVKIFPSYNDVRAAKEALRPPLSEMDFEDTKASVSLRAVSEHTIKRTLNMKRKEVEDLVERQANLKLIETELIFSRGGDSSTGQAQYQQKHQMEFHKETEDFVRKCFEQFKKEEKEMNEDPFLFVIGESVIQVKCKFYDTLIDVKVANMLADQKGSQRCFICNKTPSEFNNMTEFLPVHDGLCQFGFSQLHFVINSFRFLLNLASKNVVKKYRNLDTNQKEQVETRRNEILIKLKNEFGIIFEKPRSGGAGTTTNGSACRKVFAEPEKFNEILGLDLELVTNISIVVSLLHQLEDIDVDKFEKLCTKTHKKFFGPGGTYHWYLLSPTVHKILAHSTQIMAILPMAPGYFSEESLESHHKIFKHFRLHFARKESRLANLKDVFLRAMDKSDPKFFSLSASIRVERKINKTLPPRAQQYIKKEADEVIIDDEYTTEPASYTDNFDPSIDEELFSIFENDDDENVEYMSTDSE